RRTVLSGLARTRPAGLRGCAVSAATHVSDWRRLTGRPGSLPLAYLAPQAVGVLRLSHTGMGIRFGRPRQHAAGGVAARPGASVRMAGLARARRDRRRGDSAIRRLVLPRTVGARARSGHRPGPRGGRRSARTWCGWPAGLCPPAVAGPPLLLVVSMA